MSVWKEAIPLEPLICPGADDGTTTDSIIRHKSLLLRVNDGKTSTDTTSSSRKPLRGEEATKTSRLHLCLTKHNSPPESFILPAEFIAGSNALRRQIKSPPSPFSHLAAIMVIFFTNNKLSIRNPRTAKYFPVFMRRGFVSTRTSHKVPSHVKGLVDITPFSGHLINSIEITF